MSVLLMDCSLAANGNDGVAVAIGNDECWQPAFSSSNDEGSPVLAASVCVLPL